MPVNERGLGRAAFFICGRVGWGQGELVILGGAFHTSGNVTPAAEANIFGGALLRPISHFLDSKTPKISHFLDSKTP